MPSAAEPHPLNIFIVEDHKDSLKFLEIYLKDCGHLVHHAHCAKEALAALSHERPDVLLTDIGLPDGNGWDLMLKLRHDKNAPPYAIAMSGYGMSSDFEKSATAGFRRHLLKPLDPDQLDEALEEAARELHPEPPPKKRRTRTGGKRSS